MERLALTLIACGTVCLACSRGAVHPSAPADGIAHVVPATTQVLALTETPRSISGRVASRVPEFGGAYIERDGALTLYLTDVTRERDARGALANELLASGREGRTMRVRHGRYSFAQLWRWKNALRPLLANASVVLLTVDERANRVRIATTNSGTVALARQIDRLGVPYEAVAIVPTARIVEAGGSVDGGERPAVGGLRVVGFFAQAGHTWTIICSYGPNVRDFADTVHRYMVVASHCAQHSPPVGGFVGANVYQPDTTSLRTNLIGTVVANPSFVSGGICPAGASCRSSDAALVRIAPGVATTIEIGRAHV